MSKEIIGIMGGSFNPIHNRHLELAECAMREIRLDGVLFIPTGNPPHKHASLVSAEHRYEMTCLAAAPHEGFSVSRIELDREGIIYSVDTLHLLKNKNPNTEYVFIIGEDTLNDLPNWHHPDEVFTLCSFAVCCRTSDSASDLPIVKELEKRGACFRFLTLPPSKLSSTKAREALQRGEEPDFLPPQVLEYIRVFGLYGIPGLPGGGEIYSLLSASLSLKRFIHSLSVADTAIRLSRLHGVDCRSAELAGLLHDCAKCLSLEEMQRIALEKRLRCDDDTLESTNLLHGPVGAILARTRYGISNESILSAISCHTTGEIDMQPLDMVLFLADKTEPGRKNHPNLEKLRFLSRNNLKEGVLLALTSSRDYVLSKGGTFYEGSRLVIDWLSGQISQNNS